jgi:WD40 repeat protein
MRQFPAVALSLVLSTHMLAAEDSSHIASPVAHRGVLTPALQPAVKNLHFSPDGRYILAQNDGGVSLLTREPFQFQFRISSEKAAPARFTPNSQRVIVLRESQVEIWELSSHRLLQTRPVPRDAHCQQSEISPGGDHLVCATPGLDLLLFDIETGGMILSKPRFIESTQPNLSFSPDGRYMLASSGRNIAGYDFEAHKEIHLGSGLRKYLSSHFAWMKPDRIAGVNVDDPRHSAILDFPSGKVAYSIPLRQDTGLGTLINPAFLLLGPLQNGGVAIYDLIQQKLVRSCRREVLDLFGSDVVTDSYQGTVVHFTWNDFGNPDKEVDLKEADFGDYQSVAVSTDLRMLAVSTSQSSAIYSLDTGERLQMLRPIHAPMFWGNTLFGDFANFGASDSLPRRVAALHLDTGAAEQFSTPGDKVIVHSAGLARLFVTEGANSRRLEVRHALTNQPLWSREFNNDPPIIEADGDCSRIILDWQYKGASNTRTLEVLDGKSGAILHHLTLQMASDPSHAIAFGNSLLLMGSRTVELVSATDGELIASLPGRFGAHSPDAERMSLIEDGVELALVDASHGSVLHTYRFPSPITFTAFSEDGKRLFVLMRDQHYEIVPLAPEFLAHGGK